MWIRFPVHVKTGFPLDSPLVEVGGLTANLLNSQTNPEIWRKEVGPTQTLYAWVMNNHWGTNYRAYQEGPVYFRFILQPHGAYDPARASRLAIGASQPLLVVRAHGASPPPLPRLSIDSTDVIVTGIKPSDDGRAVIVRLWGASGRDVHTSLRWSSPAPRQIWISDTSEASIRPAGEDVFVPGWGIVTVRADLP
jgi:alpha-mannosidase